MAEHYFTQRLRNACEFLVSSDDLRTRLEDAAKEIVILQLHDHDTKDPLVKQITTVLDSLERLSSMDISEMESVSQAILELFENSLSLDDTTSRGPIQSN